MRRATITLPDDLNDQLETYLAGQEAPPSLTSIVQAALRRFLAEQQLARWQYQPPNRPLHFTPSPVGSGRSDVSLDHDRYLTESD